MIKIIILFSHVLTEKRSQAGGTIDPATAQALFSSPLTSGSGGQADCQVTKQEYVCKICAHTFTKLSSFKKHKRQHKRDRRRGRPILFSKENYHIALWVFHLGHYYWSECTNSCNTLVSDTAGSNKPEADEDKVSSRLFLVGHILIETATAFLSLLQPF